MVAHLRIDQRQPERPRLELNAMLGTTLWTLPGAGWAPRPRDPRAPWWWHDDEEASQSFMDAMGVS